jgi:hypothetical protein
VQILYSIRSERVLCEQLDYNLLFRWFVGLSIDEPNWDHSSFTKLLQLLAIDRGLVGEVERLERFDEREASHRGAHGDVPARLGGHFLPEHLLEELGVGQLACCGLLQQRLKPLTALDEPQLAQVLSEPLEWDEIVGEGRLFARSEGENSRNSVRREQRYRTSDSLPACAHGSLDYDSGPRRRTARARENESSIQHCPRRIGCRYSV